MENQIEEILEGVDKVKVSIVMQSNLTNYPGSREDAVNKFRRAVESFKNQIYKYAELIIVADGCVKTQQIYNREFANDKSIKFIYVDRKDTPRTYEITENGKYFRGFSRRLGVAAATGTVVTYMDSDDYLLPEFTMTCMLVYNIAPEMDWWINGSWYDSSSHTWEESENLQQSDHSKAITVDGLDGTWTPTVVKPGLAILSPWLFMHKATCNTKWRDTINGSEDVDFNKRLREEYPRGYSYAKPIYVRCHYDGLWDL